MSLGENSPCNGTKYDAGEDGCSFGSSVYPYDTLSRIKIDYMNKQTRTSCNSNGFLIYIPTNTNNKHTNWNDFNISNEYDFAQLLKKHAKNHTTILTDIFSLNNDDDNTHVI